MKKIKILFGLAVLTFSFTFDGFSQSRTLHDTTNTFIMDKVTENNPIGLLWWKCDFMFVGQLFTNHKVFTGLGIEDSMAIEKEWTDKKVCLHHIKYQHFYKGIKVESSEYREHFNDTGMVEVLL